MPLAPVVLPPEDYRPANPHVRRNITSQMRDRLRALAGFLRRMYPRDTARLIERDTGIPARTTERLIGTSPDNPSFENFMKILGSYGPVVLVPLMPDTPPWLVAAVKAHQAEILEGKINAARHALERLEDGNGDAGPVVRFAVLRLVDIPAGNRLAC